MKLLLTALLLSSVSVAAELPAQLKALPARDADIQLAPIDRAKAVREDLSDKTFGVPLTYALPRKLTLDVSKRSTVGALSTLKDGRVQWVLDIESAGASSIDLTFEKFFLPAGAELYVFDPEFQQVRGPFTDADNRSHGKLAVPLVMGAKARVVLRVAPAQMDFVQLDFGTAYAGFREWWKDTAKAVGDCNVDVACAVGNPWRQQMQAVARTTLSGRLCTGNLLNNTAADRKMYFITANHCRVTPDNAALISVFWNYQNSSCRTPGAIGSGGVGDGSLGQSQSGAFFRSKSSSDTEVSNSDFALLELDDAPSPAFNVFWSGWDRRDTLPSAGTGIHHPAGEVKRISFENQALTVTNYLETLPGLRTHLRVADWDLGTTEGGSSGSGLWNPDKRLVGVLSGGFAACGNDLSDWYGRMASAWEGIGGTADRRLRDWLDTTNTGALAIDGVGNCAAPSVALSGSANPVNANQDFTLSAAISGGQAPYTVSWDVDGDGVFERTGAGLTQLSARYQRGGGYAVRARVTDALGCAVEQSGAISVRASQVSLSAGTPTQLCGNNNAVIDPGERWRVPMTVTGNDTASLDAQLIFTGAGGARQSDQFGNSGALGGGCGFQFVDISSSGFPVSFQPSGGGAPALDDGVARINLVGPAVSVYGTAFSAFNMSTNGYLSTSAADNGGDYDADCPIPAVPAIAGVAVPSPGARLYALHRDLVIDSAHFQSFNVCPRLAEVGGAQACTIFQWNNARFFQQGGTTTGNFRMQAILYQGSGQIVYQYDGPNLPALASTVGLQNASASDGLNLSCGNATAIRAGQSACIFQRNNQPSSRGPLRLETPAVALASVGGGNPARSINVDFQVRPEAACGAAGLDFAGMVDSNTFQGGTPNISQFNVGSGTGCTSVSNCPYALTQIQPRAAAYFNPARGGNGIDIHFFPTPTGSQANFGWYTGRADRSPIWYGGEGIWLDRQAPITLTENRWNGSSSTSSVVGSGVLTAISTERMVLNFILKGRTGGEPLTFFSFGTPGNAPNYTGLWFDPTQPGWGFTVNSQAQTQLIAAYTYDTAGLPFWTVGTIEANVAAPFTLEAVDSHCPACVWIAPLGRAAGTLQRNFTDLNKMQVNLNVTDARGPWLRTNRTICKIGTQC